MPSLAKQCVRRFDESKSTARKEKKMDLIKLTISFVPMASFISNP